MEAADQSTPVGTTPNIPDLKDPYEDVIAETEAKVAPWLSKQPKEIQDYLRKEYYEHANAGLANGYEPNDIKLDYLRRLSYNAGLEGNPESPVKMFPQTATQQTPTAAPQTANPQPAAMPQPPIATQPTPMTQAPQPTEVQPLPFKDRFDALAGQYDNLPQYYDEDPQKAGKNIVTAIVKGRIPKEEAMQIFSQLTDKEKAEVALQWQTSPFNGVSRWWQGNQADLVDQLTKPYLAKFNAKS